MVRSIIALLGRGRCINYPQVKATLRGGARRVLELDCRLLGGSPLPVEKGGGLPNATVRDSQP